MKPPKLPRRQEEAKVRAEAEEAARKEAEKKVAQAKSFKPRKLRPRNACTRLDDAR